MNIKELRKIKICVFPVSACDAQIILRRINLGEKRLGLTSTGIEESILATGREGIQQQRQARHEAPETLNSHGLDL